MFPSCDHDLCYYINGSGFSLVILTSYVDDPHLAAEEVKNLLFIKRKLCRLFYREDCVDANMRLGLETNRDRGQRSLKICQAIYANKIQERLGMLDS